MSYFYELVNTYAKPFTSAFYLLFFILLLSFLLRKTKNKKASMLIIIGFSAVFYFIYILLDASKSGSVWLNRLSNPIYPVVIFLVIPAMLFNKQKWYRYFLFIPALLIIFAFIDIYHHYSSAPEGIGFSWFLIRPGFLLPALVSFLIIVQRFTTLDTFRKTTRITMLILLLYGGFVFRQNFIDYSEALSRRKDMTADVMALNETVPVMKYDDQLVYLPAAPCRFSQDGGYVQGCVMELFQRIMQLDFRKVASGNPSETSLLAIAVAAFLALLILLYIGARMWCGWICPLSTIGDALDFIRRKCGLPHLKPSRPIKLAYFFSGLTLATFTLFLAKLYPRIDENGKFMGCKIPLYPFCKICPGQQVCPVASAGFDQYPPVPGMEWLFGFFRFGVIIMLGIFLIGFMTARKLWCRFCPMGMVGGIFNKGGMIALKKINTKCNSCGVCSEVCPIDIQYVQMEMEKKDVSNFDCVYCLKCVDKCPQDKCLSFEFASKNITESDFTGKEK